MALQFSHILFPDGPDDIILLSLDGRHRQRYLFPDVRERVPVVVQEKVLLRKPHFEKGRVQVIGDLHEPELCQHHVGILIREQADQDNEGAVDDVGEDQFIFYFHGISLFINKM
jgi:hypothetical protein